jgi:ABC-type antimicrobial peptide transport system permease subunit
MDNVVKISAEAVPSVASNLIVNVMAVMCGLALVVFACMATSGLDMSAGFF